MTQDAAIGSIPGDAQGASTAADSELVVGQSESLSTRSWLYDRALPLRLFSIQVVNYLTNHVVAHVPSFTLRRLWYRYALGIQFDRHASVFMGTYMWFYSPGSIRRNGVRVGRNSRINRDCTLDLRGGLTIGDNVSISPEVMLLGGSHDFNHSWGFGDVTRPISIEDHAFIGTRAMILPGVTVGRGAVVTAGSLVSRDVAPRTIVAGVPARRVGTRNPTATAYELGWPPPLFE
jgi:acetyltransferase-like isoleucine patch superfamily enzyme